YIPGVPEQRAARTQPTTAARIPRCPVAPLREAIGQGEITESYGFAWRIHKKDSVRIIATNREARSAWAVETDPVGNEGQRTRKVDDAIGSEVDGGRTRGPQNRLAQGTGTRVIGARDGEIAE